MKTMKTDELREVYLEFFESKGHARRPSDVLVPHGDPSVLFTPAGMNQFKDHFLGRVKLDFTRATTSQKCLRTGDIDNVGRTSFHHTFFEMLGNFSFGDYFKREAIQWAWEFLTDPKWLAIDPAQLSVSVYLDDDEAAGIWLDEIGLSAKQIQRMGEDDNFWPAGAPTQGPDGVCGPCSEIFYHTPDGQEVEIWNLVFTQFNRVGDPPDNLRPLPSKNIDTGMGLERIASVLQGVETNFHIDSLRPIVEAAAGICSRTYKADSDDGRRLRRITDHVRACTFAIHEDVEPGTKKQSYVIRRLLRRAILDGHQMGLREPFLYQLVNAVVDQMKVPYPELAKTQSRVADEIKAEEALFFGTIDEGVSRIEKLFESMESSSRVMVHGDEAADLYTTYGVPPELLQQLANERGLTFDWDGYREAMEEHGRVSGGERGELFKTGAIESIKAAVQRTEFVGYDQTSCEAIVKGVVEGDKACETLGSDSERSDIVVILDQSPFYGESGGQVGDVGTLTTGEMTFEVVDTQKDGDILLHIGRLTRGELKAGMTVQAEVDVDRRHGIQRAHSATHMLHHALQKFVGEHAQQRGSKVEADQLRFDFKNRSQLESDVLEQIETDVAQKVQAGLPIHWTSLPIEEARQSGAMMLFGEKYPDMVRMVTMGDFSKELCGGTHLLNTGDVEEFEIIGEEAVSAGTRRIVALTGDKAKAHKERVSEQVVRLGEQLGVAESGVIDALQALMTRVRSLKKQVSSGQRDEKQAASKAVGSQGGESLDYSEQRGVLREAARLLNSPPFEVAGRIDGLLDEVVTLEKELENLGSAEEMSADVMLESARDFGGVKAVFAQLPVANPNLMRQLIDQVRQRTSDSVVVLVGAEGKKVLMVCGVSKGLIGKISATELVKQAAPLIGGGGGGRPEMAQAGGKDSSRIPEALAAAESFVAKALG